MPVNIFFAYKRLKLIMFFVEYYTKTYSIKFSVVLVGLENKF